MIMRKLENRIAQTLKTDTRLVVQGRNPDETFGFVNIPPYRGSTVTYPDAQSCLAGKNRYTYGRRGNPTSEALENLWNDLEGSAGTVICPSGASAVTTAILSAVKTGDHILVTDSVYRPTRNFCTGLLARLGVETSYYDPLIGAGIEALIRPNTRVIYMESPGSQTFEVQDVPAIVAVARKHGITTMIDNTYATALLFRPLDFGVDISINAATKYPSGHSDVLIGLVAANETAFPALKSTHGDLGLYLGPDDVFLTLRGLRTMGLRLREQGANALLIARELESRKGVKRVLHPALPSCPGHAIFQRDFKGPSGLFSIILDIQSDEQVAAFLNNLSLFGMGYSWGGFESLAVPFDCTSFRTATVYNPGGRGIRLNIGLEDTSDLLADLDRGLAAMHAAG
ncbi:MAG: cystathionine beta-lyase [Rhizobiales bacterium]|nr:cystathionine beta-lyase [Hyphomicrobiales bacterium]